MPDQVIYTALVSKQKTTGHMPFKIGLQIGPYVMNMGAVLLMPKQSNAQTVGQ